MVNTYIEVTKLCGDSTLFAYVRSKLPQFVSAQFFLFGEGVEQKRIGNSVDRRRKSRRDRN